jgi:hypothetical protein
MMSALLCSGREDFFLISHASLPGNKKTL